MGENKQHNHTNTHTQAVKRKHTRRSCEVKDPQLYITTGTTATYVHYNNLITSLNCKKTLKVVLKIVNISHTLVTRTSPYVLCVSMHDTCNFYFPKTTWKVYT